MGRKKLGNAAVSYYWCFQWGLTAEPMGTSFSTVHEASYVLLGLGRRQEARTGCCLFSRHGFLHAMKSIVWNGWKLIVCVGFIGHPWKRELSWLCFLHGANRMEMLFILRSLRSLLKEKEELWFQSHSQRRIQKKWQPLCPLNPYFQRCVLKCWFIACGKQRELPMFPCPRYCSYLSSGSQVQKLLNGRKIDFPQCQTKGDFLFFFSQNRIYKPLSITSRILPELSRERNQCGNSIPLGNVKWQQVGPSTICPTLNIKWCTTNLQWVLHRNSLLGYWLVIYLLAQKNNSL